MMAKQILYEAILKLDTGSHTAHINQLLVTPDGKSLITAGADKTIRVWDIETKKQTSLLLGQIGQGADGSIQAISVSHNGKYIVSLAWIYPNASQDQHTRETDLRVYELATGNLQAGFRFTGTLQDLDFSRDDKFLALTGRPNDTRNGLVMIFETKKIIRGFGNLSSPMASAILYKNDLIPAYVRFVPEKRGSDGSYRLVAASWEHWRPGAPEYSGRLFWFTLSESARLMEEINKEIDDQIAPNSLTVSSRFVIVPAEATSQVQSKKFYCYEHDGRLVNVVDSETFPARPAFSRDENQLIVGQREDSAMVQIKVYDTAFGQFPLKSTYFGHDSAVHGTALLENGIAVSAGGDQNAIHFWSTEHMEGEKTAEISGVGRVLHVVGISPDGQIGFGYRDDLRLKDGTMVLQRAFDLRSMTLKSFPFQDAGEFRRAEKTFGDLSLEFSERFNWNLGLLPNRSTFGSSLGWFNVSTFGFTEKGSVVAGSPDGKVRYWKRSPEGRYSSEHFLLGHESSVRDHASSGRWLVTVGADQVIRLWDLEDAENGTADLPPALNLFAGSDDEWVIWSKSGYYNASQRGDRRFGYHINRGLNFESLYFPSDRFIKSFFRPDIIQAILDTGSEERALAKLKTQAVSAEPLDVSKILPPIVELSRNGITLTKNKVTFKFSVETLNPQQPVTRVWVVQNDKFAWQADKRAKTFKVTLSLAPRQNLFKILAETENTKAMPLILKIMGPEPKVQKGGVLGDTGSARGVDEAKAVASSTLMETKEPGRLFLLAVGVSEFVDTKSGVNFLKYADDDAASIYNAFGNGDLADHLEGKGRSESIRTKLKNKAFESVEATILTNQFATRKAILAEVKRICDEIGERAKSKKPKRDVFMVFLSGHGVRLVGGPINDLYFWNYDAVFNDLERTGLSFMDLGKQITCVPTEVILATDACHSGMSGRDIVRELDANELAKRIYAINERGLYILNAARSEEKAREFDKISHGVFARSILDALNKQADPDISMIGLMDFVQRQMRYYMGVKQTPVFRTYGDLLPLTIYNK